MPICVKDYTWTENDASVYVTVPLKGVKRNKVDIFSTSFYIKISYPPYLFEVLLYAPVDEVKSVAKIVEGAVILTLVKESPVIWGNLLDPQSEDKSYLLKRKQEAVDLSLKKAEDKKIKDAEEKQKRQKFAVQQQMKVDDDERTRIASWKEQERILATKDIEKIRGAHHQQPSRTGPEIIELDDDDDDEPSNSNNPTENIESFPKSAANINNNIITSTTKSNSNKTENLTATKSKRGPNKKTPAQYKTGEIFEGGNIPDEETNPGPRTSGNIVVSFTPRVFPTAARESQHIEEEEWLQKQADARRVAEIDDPDLKDEEKDPDWLKDKGIQLFQNENYQGSINAFTQAIRLNPKMPALYSNRAACHMKVRNFIKCLEDSSKALELLTPPVPANSGQRLKAHVRRGTAFCELELYVEGLQDYEAALKLDPENIKLKLDSENIRKVIQGSCVQEDSSDPSSDESSDEIFRMEIGNTK